MWGSPLAVPNRLSVTVREEAASNWDLSHGALVDGLVLAPFAGALLVICAWVYRPLFHLLTDEDRILEWLQFAGYAIATGIGAWIAARLRRLGNRPIAVLYVAFTAGCLFIAGEEVSWGQRIFNEVTPPSIDAINVQHEMNLHNLNGVHQHHHLYAMLVCSIICYAIPLSDRFVPAIRNLYRRFNMPIFPSWMFALPAIGFAFMFGARFHGGADFRLDEMGELYLGFGFFGFALTAYREASAAFETSIERSASPEAIAEAPVPPGLAASH
jgi:hypothetical protein